MPSVIDTPWTLDLGARLLGPSEARFRVWAPKATTVEVRFSDSHVSPAPLAPAQLGYFEGVVAGIRPGTRYRYVLDGRLERPDPVSRHQPDGVHGPSAIVDPIAFPWSDASWKGLRLDQLILYELHVGTFTGEGSFDAIIPRLPALRDDLGVTAIELMPVAQFPGTRNWGYDGTYPYAPQTSYGGPDGLKRLIDACHREGLAVVLDVVYNHLGPEGNYLGDFGPYFTDRYRTPWGAALNFDGSDSDEVRHYVVSNALYWVTEYHIDGLRLDAVHGIFDFSARHILDELADAVHHEARRLGRNILVIAESDLNDTRLIAEPTEGGYGLDAQWSDDFHHALHTVITRERFGYYEDFGRVDQLATAVRDGFIYGGQRSPFRRRRHGNSSAGRPPSQFVVAAQNHDQVGNRAQGDRLSALAPHAALKAAAAVLLLGPNVPLLFMGEEYAETAPFLYFVDHGDPGLVEAVRRGRAEEFASFAWAGEVPDPQSPETFHRSMLTPAHRHSDDQRGMLTWYRTLIEVRSKHPALRSSHRPHHTVWSWEDKRLVGILRPGPHPGDADALVIVGFADRPTTIRFDGPKNHWTLVLDAAEKRFGGSGTASTPSALTFDGTATSLTLPPYPALLWMADRLTP